MRKKLPLIIAGIFLLAVIVMLVVTGKISFGTYGEDANSANSSVTSIEDLEDGCFYVWHNESANDITEDLEGTFAEDTFKLCPSGEINWDKNEFIAHTLWFNSNNDVDIPTLYQGDSLVYISSSTVPFKGITWERFSDYGYSIGVANLVGDESGHYRIENQDGKGYIGYLSKNSDAYTVNDFTDISYLFLDKIGKVPIRDNNVSDGGTVLGLSKDQKYICEWYTGTYYQDYEMTASVRPFCFLETFTTYDYEFLHSNCIEIVIPEWFKTGYYYIQNVGFFRYVSSEESGLYNKEPYDENIDWNDPIILYDEEGKCIYNPSTGIDLRNETSKSQDNAIQENEDDYNEYEDESDGGLEIYGLEDDEMVEYQEE